VKAKLGIAPIAWWNDDLEELSDDVSLEECLRQASEAGFTGMETGRRFPMDASVLGPILKAHEMSVCGGWFSGQLLDGDMETEKQRIATQMALFKAVDAPCIVYGECARTIQGDRSKPLATKLRLSEDEIKKLNTIQKLAKHVLSHALGDEVEDKSSKPMTLAEAVDQMKAAAANIKKTMTAETRFEVSAVVIANSNEVISLAQFIKRTHGKTY